MARDAKFAFHAADRELDPIDLAAIIRILMGPGRSDFRFLQADLCQDDRLACTMLTFARALASISITVTSNSAKIRFKCNSISLTLFAIFINRQYYYNKCENHCQDMGIVEDFCRFNVKRHISDSARAIIPLRKV